MIERIRNFFRKRPVVNYSGFIDDRCIADLKRTGRETIDLGNGSTVTLNYVPGTKLEPVKQSGHMRGTGFWISTENL
jgi:hypothetical protein